MELGLERSRCPAASVSKRGHPGFELGQSVAAFGEALLPQLLEQLIDFVAHADLP